MTETERRAGGNERPSRRKGAVSKQLGQIFLLNVNFCNYYGEKVQVNNN